MRYRKPGPAPAEFTPWKPIQCEEPGCKTMDPCFSRNGPEGPWRCGPCDQVHAHETPEPPPSSYQPPVAPDPQSRLL